MILFVYKSPLLNASVDVLVGQSSLGGVFAQVVGDKHVGMFLEGHDGAAITLLGVSSVRSRRIPVPTVISFMYSRRRGTRRATQNLTYLKREPSAARAGSTPS